MALVLGAVQTAGLASHRDHPGRLDAACRISPELVVEDAWAGLAADHWSANQALCRERARDYQSASGHGFPLAKNVVVRWDAHPGAQVRHRVRLQQDEPPMAVGSRERLAVLLVELWVAQQVQLGESASALVVPAQQVLPLVAMLPE